MSNEVKMPLCEVCSKNVAVGVAAVPGLPCSAAYCAECLAADAHPYYLVVANTACCGGLKKCAPWWQDLVQQTLTHLGKTEEEFNKDVEKDIELAHAMDAECSEPAILDEPDIQDESEDKL
jgi:hypothetical protein